MTLGIIGVGLMGHGIARNLLLKGFDLRFLDHPGNRPVDEILSLGGISCASPAEVVSGCEAVILCVTGSAQVEAVLTGAEGVIPAMPRGCIVIDCSTSLPDSTLRMATLVRESGGEFIDAPMTRTAQHAHEGRLNLLVGGEAEVIGRALPILSAFAEEVRHVGTQGAGHRMKLLHNYVSLGSLALIAEAAAHAADGGVDPDAFVEVLASGGAGGTALQRIALFITQGNRDALPFAIANAAKDLGYYLEMARAAGATHEVADGISRALDHAVSQGHGADYVPELVRILRRE
ncbi:NAD(P)-dependent oxidoreductase [Paracoccus ravus]|uniref:NAD(P)-dependent oxidoreductase n=1 Tax=Paracoccus ravus TaxID=2447760 RepID=UPI00106E93AE|nr:NAD(P)-dependent oxidoreductase [Paracoccus ravus]